MKLKAFYHVITQINKTNIKKADIKLYKKPKKDYSK